MKAETLAKQPAAMESKQGISCNCEFHYRYFAKLYEEEARKSELLAAKHEQMARDYRVGREAEVAGTTYCPGLAWILPGNRVTHAGDPEAQAISRDGLTATNIWSVESHRMNTPIPYPWRLNRLMPLAREHEQNLSRERT